jgi:nitrogenase molybdenum-iron protein NifN
LYGEQDFVIAMASFLQEVGIKPVLCVSGSDSKTMRNELQNRLGENHECLIRDDSDFCDLEREAKEIKPDIMIGNSKGYKISRELDIPLVRIGFPIHDRIGGARLQHIGYRGTQQLFDRIVNALIENRQDSSPMGYFYM